MSDGVFITYKEQNKFDKYLTLTTSEKKNIDDVVTMFIKELTTVKGSNVFDKEYGSTFMNDISKQVNFYKIEHFIKNSYSDLYEKYGIVSLDVSGVSMNVHTGFLDIRLKIIFEEYALEHYTKFLYDGVFTNDTIIEME
jgi:hypothetical protein